ncbi:MAG: protein translocase subunit SecF [Chloroflexi bacterium]|nr:protein translocase subunit SecF [Chloroflexota bacterium]
MFNLVQKRRWYFTISAVLLAISLISMVYSTFTIGSPLRLGIDFVGGSLLEVGLEQSALTEAVRNVVVDAGYADPVVNTVVDDQTFLIRTKEMNVAAKDALVERLEARFGPVTERRYESVGPTIGRETTRSAGLAIVAASLAILVFIAFAFRSVPNALRYGVCAITKMLHDVMILLGLASIMGLVAGWEVDALFLTAVLTVVGFSVEDVIVVFDRIRENIGRRRNEDYETTVNRSLLETLHRSLATQLNAIFVMVAIILFGGTTIRQFMLTMLIGMVTGTYSSIFIAVPLLVVWERGEFGRVWQMLRNRRTEVAEARG